MKTKLYVEPGTALDWDNENHRRHIEEDAFSEPPHPRPTMQKPERMRSWWFWRFLGMTLFIPARRLWAYYRHAYYARLPNGDLGPWTYRYPSSKRVERWLNQHGDSPVRKFFYWLFVKDYWVCPHCGFTEYDSEYTVFATKENEEDRTIELFELVEGGGHDYWGEANDCRGWQWCYRCGGVAWETI